MPYLTFLSRKLPPSVRITFLIMSLLYIASGCNSRPHYQADISDVKIEPVEIKRYEEALFTIDPDNLREEIEPYVDEFELFLGEVIYTQMGQQQLYDYITSDFNREIYQDMISQWDDLSGLEKELTRAFRYFHYHFPLLPVPRVFSYMSGLNFEQPVYFQDDVVVIGLDMFMGRNYEGYDQLSIPAFKRVRFIPEAVPVETMREIGNYLLHSGADMPENLLDFFVFQGKLLYFLDAMLPSAQDSLKISYTSEQMEWAKTNEGQSWSFILNNEMLYSSDRQIIQKLTGEAPFTGPFSSGSAPRMGMYHGWKIVREYMRRNPETTLQELLFEKNDSREILMESRYRP